MDNTKELLKNIIEGIQDKKGSKITVVDLTDIETSICQYFVICQGNSANQTTAITKSVGDRLRENCATKPFAVSGVENGVWIVMDYNDIFVHIFQPEERDFYDLEHLWADAKLTNIPDIE